MLSIWAANDVAAFSMYVCGYQTGRKLHGAKVMSAQLQTVDSQQFMRAVTRGIQSMYARMPEIRWQRKVEMPKSRAALSLPYPI